MGYAASSAAQNSNGRTSNPLGFLILWNINPADMDIAISSKRDHLLIKSIVCSNRPRRLGEMIEPGEKSAAIRKIPLSAGIAQRNNQYAILVRKIVWGSWSGSFEMSLNNEAGAILQRGLILRKSLPATRTLSFRTKPYLLMLMVFEFTSQLSVHLIFLSYEWVISLWHSMVNPSLCDIRISGRKSVSWKCVAHAHLFKAICYASGENSVIFIGSNDSRTKSDASQIWSDILENSTLEHDVRKKIRNPNHKKQ